MFWRETLFCAVRVEGEINYYNKSISFGKDSDGMNWTGMKMRQCTEVIFRKKISADMVGVL